MAASNDEGGCAIIIGFLLVIWACSGIWSCAGKQWSSWREDREKAAQQEAFRKSREQQAVRQAQQADEKAKAEAALEADLQKFGKQLAPQLQQAIDKYQEQVRQFSAQRAAFAQEMSKLGVDPDQRPAYKLRGELIEKMKKDVEQLLAARKETYIKWKELQLLRDTEGTKAQRAALLRAAQDSAKSAEETFEKYMKQSEGAVK